MTITWTPTRDAIDARMARIPSLTAAQLATATTLRRDLQLAGTGYNAMAPTWAADYTAAHQAVDLLVRDAEQRQVDAQGGDPIVDGPAWEPGASVLTPSIALDVDVTDAPIVAASATFGSFRVTARLIGAAGNAVQVKITDVVQRAFNAGSAGGTSPPVVTIAGALLEAYDAVEVEVDDTSGGTGLGQAKFRWRADAGAWTSGVLTAASVVLTGTGATLAFGVGPYTNDNTYSWRAGYASAKVWAKIGDYEESTIAIAPTTTTISPRSFILIACDHIGARAPIPPASGYVFLSGGTGGSFDAIAARIERARRLPAAAEHATRIDDARRHLAEVFAAQPIAGSDVPNPYAHVPYGAIGSVLYVEETLDQIIERAAAFLATT